MHGKCLATPHVLYVGERLYRTIFADVIPTISPCFDVPKSQRR